MCGIIGVTGAADPLQVLLDALALLEYRGYDSAGVALIDGDSVWRRRDAVRGHSLDTLRKAQGQAPKVATAGIGHTRWATHGAAVEHNAHPHCDCTGQRGDRPQRHHRELSRALGQAYRRGPHALLRDRHGGRRPPARARDRTGAGLAEALRRCVGELRGDFALAAVCTEEPQVVVAARRTSPLIFGQVEGMGLVASDIAALLGTTRRLYQLADDEIAEVRPGSIVVVGLDGQAHELVPLEVGWDLVAAQRDGFADFMSKEIHEQPRALRDTRWAGSTPMARPSSRS